MDETLIRVVRYFTKNRDVSFAEAQRQLVASGLEAWQVDYALEWLQAVSGGCEPRKIRRSVVPPAPGDSAVLLGPGFNLTPAACTLMIGLRELGVVCEDRFRDLVRRAFRLPEAVGVEDLQEMLLNDAYERMTRWGNGAFIEEQERWGSKN